MSAWFCFLGLVALLFVTIIGYCCVASELVALPAGTGMIILLLCLVLKK